MYVTKKLIMTKESKNEIINGLKSLILYNDCYEEVFGQSLSEFAR